MAKNDLEIKYGSKMTSKLNMAQNDLEIKNGSK